MATKTSHDKIEKFFRYREELGSTSKAAKLAGIALRTGQVYWKNRFEGFTPKRSAVKESKQVTNEIEKEIDNEKDEIRLFVLSPRIRTVDEAVKKAEIDLKHWEIIKVQVKSWEVGTKVEGFDSRGFRFTRGIAVEPLFGVTATFRKKTGLDRDAFVKEFEKRMRAAAPVYRSSNKVTKSTVRAEISIPDIHFGKYAWADETGEQYNLAIAERRYLDAATTLVERSIYSKPERFIFPIGNDLLHVDRGSNTTTKGTHLEADGRWQEAYLKAFDSVTRAIELMLEIAPVDVIVVPGNHDEEKAFTFGHAIQCRFHSAKHVTVDNTPKLRKYYEFGKNLVAFQHGHTARDRKMLPMDIANEAKDAWARTCFRHIHLGHFHKEKEDVYVFQRHDSENEVIVRYIPSLCGTDLYHYKNSYHSIQSAECHIWDRDDGPIAIHSSRLAK